MKFGICSEIFKGWEWKQIVRYVARTGYDGIEIAPFALADSVTRISTKERKKIKSLADENNLEIIGLHWLLAAPKGLSLSSPEKKLRKKTIDYLKELISFCSELGGRIMVFGSPKQRNIPSSSSYQDTWKRVRDGFLEVMPLAKKMEVTIALEPLARTETNFINTAEEAIKMITELNYPNFQLNLDVKAMSDEKKPVPEIIISAKNYLVHFHANDPNLLGPGFGETDYYPIKKVLQKIDYDGYLSVEVFDFSPGAEAIAEKSIKYLQQIFE